MPANENSANDEDNNRMTGVIVKHLTDQADTPHSCTGFPIPGYPVYEVQ